MRYTTMKKIEEIKRHKNKLEQRFVCDLVLREQDHIVLAYHASTAGRIADIDIAPGSTTIAQYWQNSGYVLWRMFSADHTLVGTLFHICKNTAIGEYSVSYDDLILDIWITPQGIARVLDVDELAEAIKAGLVTIDEQVWIDKQKQIILSDYSGIIDRIRNIEATVMNLEQL
jgi:protein associated with RNAse G/E